MMASPIINSICSVGFRRRPFMARPSSYPTNQFHCGEASPTRIGFNSVPGRNPEHPRGREAAKLFPGGISAMVNSAIDAVCTPGSPDFLGLAASAGAPHLSAIH